MMIENVIYSKNDAGAHTGVHDKRQLSQDTHTHTPDCATHDEK